MIDCCLIIEGAYPYVSGGVSTWVHALLTNLPELHFAVVHIGSKPDPTRTMKYQLPPNVVEFREVFIHDVAAISGTPRAHTDPALWHMFYDLHKTYATGDFAAPQHLKDWLAHPDLQGIRPVDLFNSRQSWEMLERLCREQALDQSFVDYFWTFRFSHLPLFALIQAQLPEAKVYHAISTGFGGLLGAIAKLRTGRPFLVTEHGVYTNERTIEIAQADWIYDAPETGYQIGEQFGFFKRWWDHLFRMMVTLTYETADRVISINRVNSDFQNLMRTRLKGDRRGALTRWNKWMMIPNGIAVEKYRHLRDGWQPDPDRYRIGFVGRVVPIKDVKTFLRAISAVRKVIPTLQALIIGPDDEDEEYAAECQKLMHALKLEGCLTFTGPADVKEYYAQIDVLVLTSLSEGVPLVILEGNCAGVPVVATHVGSCQELLEGGLDPADRALGPSGLITPAASPQATADALIQLWRDPDLRRAMGQAGQRRVAQFYREETVYAAYRELYAEYLHGNDAV